MNTNPKCTRCGGQTFRASQTCFACGRDQVDQGPLYVSEKRDTWAVEGRYPDGRGAARRIYDEERPLPGFEGLI